MSSNRPCPACRARAAVAAYEHEGVAYVHCDDCGSIYHSAEPDWDRIARIYQEDYHAARGHDDRVVEATKRATVLPYLRLIERHGPPGTRYVEVGCSAGAALQAVAEAGWDACGVELSAPSAELARRRPGVRAVYTGTLEQAPLCDGEVDVLTMFDVIEHIDPPDGVLATIHRKLRPGGLTLMVTPDAGSLSARWMGARWPHLFVEHVILFSRRGLRIALERAGFEVLRCGFAWKRVNLEILVRHARLHPHVAMGGVLRWTGKVMPGALLRAMVPFNIGEFYILARRR